MITFTNELKNVWVDRWSNGYAPIPDLPDQKAYIQTKSQAFGLDNTIDNITTVDASIPEGKHVVSAAFEYLIDGSYATEIHDFLVAQLQVPGVQYDHLTALANLGNGADNISFSSEWVYRMFLVYDYTRDLYSAAEVTMIETYFYNAAVFFLRSINERVLSGRIEKRNADSAWSSYINLTDLLTDQGSQASGS